MKTKNARCVHCNKACTIADDQTDPGHDEVAVDSRGLVSANDYVCGECLEDAEDAMIAARKSQAAK